MGNQRDKVKLPYKLFFFDFLMNVLSGWLYIQR